VKLGFLNRQDPEPEKRPVEPEPRRPARSDLLSEIESVGIGTFWATDSAGRLAYLSDKAVRLFGKHADSLIGKEIGVIFRETDDDQDMQSQRSLTFRMRSHSKIENQVVEIDLSASGGKEVEEASKRWWRISARPYFDEAGNFQGYRGNASDITSDFRHQQSLARHSQYDELTGLANRRRLTHRLTSMLAAFKTNGRSLALMMLDLDRFKQVNDTMGHPAGDQLLKLVSERLTTIIKDRGEVGRIGGDEFQILLPDMDDRGELAELASRLIQMVSQPYTINGRRAIIGTSVGIAIAPYDGLDTAELNSAVDLALYSAKEGGKGTYRFYMSDMKDDARNGIRIQEELRDALAKGELFLKYQPLVDPLTEKVKSFEALMRWEHPELGNVSPSLFIPIAEQTDLIVQLGDWALKKACADAAEWPGHLRVAVNVSARQFINSDFTRAVAAALAHSQLPPGRLELEITESVFVGDVESVDKTFRTLKRLGVRLVMDDFGTGYSSLGYLKRAPFDKIKIDQSFVRGCTSSGDTNPAIITAIVALAKALDMETVAEGVEAMDELALVRERGADLVQGYIYSQPLTNDEVIDRLDKGELKFSAQGPPRYRADRMSVYRKIGLIHEDHYYEVMLRNISKSGARIQGLGGVPVGEELVLDLGGGQLAVGRVVRSKEDTQGIQFETQLISDGYNGLMTRHRISPYALAEAGMPLGTLGSRDRYPMARMAGGANSPPKFIQFDLSSTEPKS
jgi:diguanylate cyclase (GGDEF)-like protein/PAS domain S-box-containing protein